MYELVEHMLFQIVSQFNGFKPGSMSLEELFFFFSTVNFSFKKLLWLEILLTLCGEGSEINLFVVLGFLTWRALM